MRVTLGRRFVFYLEDKCFVTSAVINKDYSLSVRLVFLISYLICAVLSDYFKFSVQNLCELLFTECPRLHENGHKQQTHTELGFTLAYNFPKCSVLFKSLPRSSVFCILAHAAFNAKTFWEDERLVLANGTEVLILT